MAADWEWLLSISALACTTVWTEGAVVYIRILLHAVPNFATRVANVADVVNVVNVANVANGFAGCLLTCWYRRPR